MTVRRVAVIVIVGVAMLVMRVLAEVLVLVQVHVESLLGGLAACDHLDPAMLHAAGRKNAICELPELVGRALEDDDLEAVGLVEMNVHRGAHLRAEPVLQLDQSFRQVANVVVVDQRDGRHGVGPSADLGARYLGTCKIAEHLRTCAVSLLHQRIEGAQQRALHRHTEPHEVIAFGHGASVHDAGRARVMRQTTKTLERS